MATAGYRLTAVLAFLLVAGTTAAAGRAAIRPVVRRPGLSADPRPTGGSDRSGVAEPARDAGCRRRDRREPEAQSQSPQVLPGRGVRLRGP